MGIIEAIDKMKITIDAIKIMFIIIIFQNICTSVFLLCHHLDIRNEVIQEEQTQEYIHNGHSLPPMEELEYPD